MRGLLGNGYEPSLITIYSVPAFLLLFLLIFWLVYRKSQKEKYEQYAKLPLEKDDALNSEGNNHG
ncbi:MAG: cbb3-type cytochrome c oxidase subunit 3 [Bdellovibrionales bacterium]|nr:cbb3-type cytochrome c oxidase subunit 3 [Bdellovibrionales bacterium]